MPVFARSTLVSGNSRSTAARAASRPRHQTSAGIAAATALLTGLVAALLALPAAAVAVGERVDNFRLLDHSGQSHELYYYDDAKAVVLMAHSNHCSVVQSALPRLQALQERFGARGVRFFLLNASSADSRAAINAEVTKIGSALPVLMDQTQLIAEALQLSKAGEVLVLDPRDWTIAYRGALDDSLLATAASDKPRTAFVDNALTALLGPDSNPQPLASVATVAAGCPVELPGLAARPAHAQISYAQDVAPILLKNCVSCHREGGIGPWAMNSYTMIQGFSPMIREVLRTQRMPPWHADPAHGDFSNDRSLSAAQIQTLVHWIEAGSPRGDGADPLAANDQQYTQWEAETALGKPDFVVAIPAAEIPATGVVDYQYHHVKNPIGRDVWVQAAEILPGDRAVLHHVITTFGDMVQEGPYKGRLKPTGGLRGYAPGMTNQAFPENTGVFLPADATLEFQVHYTTNGKATVDESKMGLWFYEEKPEKQVFSQFIANGKIRIPAHARAHAESETYQVPKDAIVYNLLPHAHFRGKAAEFRAYYPDGREELLLSVPNYDFNWQTTYEFTEPKFMPAGTRIVQTNWWDNSAQNKANPDPDIEVTWGEQSWEEMLFGAFLMRVLDEDEAAAMRSAQSNGESPQVAGAR